MAGGSRQTADEASAASTATEAASIIARFEQGAWALAALAHVCRTASIEGATVTTGADQDATALRVLVAAGLAIEDRAGFSLAPGAAELMTAVPPAQRAAATTSMLRQIAATTGAPSMASGDRVGWAANDDATLLAQGRASAMAGQMLATAVVDGLAGLAERFADGGRFLDVGTGVGELAAAFASIRPDATIVGLDVLPRAIELAREMITRRDLGARFEVRHQGVEDLDETERYDLAWIPAPFIPQRIFGRALGNIHRALAPGGWIVVAAGRLEGDDLGVAVTRWQTELIGGTALTADDAAAALTSAGFTEVAVVPTPPGAPAVYCGRRPPAAGGSHAG